MNRNLSAYLHRIRPHSITFSDWSRWTGYNILCRKGGPDSNQLLQLARLSGNRASKVSQVFERRGWWWRCWPAGQWGHRGRSICRGFRFFFLLLPLFTLSTLSFLPTSLTILLLFFSPLGVCSTGDHQNALRSNVPIRAGLLSTIIGTGIYRKRKRRENRMEEKPFHPLWSHSQQGLDLRLVYPLTTDEVKGYRQIFAHKKTGKKNPRKIIIIMKRMNPSHHEIDRGIVRVSVRHRGYSAGSRDVKKKGMYFKVLYSFGHFS